MKRKTVLRLLCLSIVSAMLVSTPCLAFAYEQGEKREAMYNGKRIEVVIDGDYVILPDDERILLEDFTGEFIEEEALTPVVPPAEEEKESESEDSGQNSGDGKEQVPEESDEGEKEDEQPEENGENEEKDGPPGAKGEDGEAGGISQENNVSAEEEKSPEEVHGNEAGRLSEENGENDGEESLITKEDTLTGPPTVTAGISFYVEELAEKYHLTFQEEFKDTVSEIEQEFLAEVKHVPIEEMESKRISRLTKDLLLSKNRAQEYEEEDETIFTNWQDVLAVYLLEESRRGADTYIMDASDKEGISAVFERMNHATIVENEVVVTAKTVEDYRVETEDLSEADYEFLKKYTSPNCSLLCASTTGIQGFIVQSLGEGVSRERAQVVEAAYSLVGKIPYYYGGKSSVIGWDLRWGRPKYVTGAGVLQMGKEQEYGLDCSGFVTWAFINGYEDESAAGRIGHGTSSQWCNCDAVSEKEAQPGDLVFLDGPEATGPNNHVGIVAGHNDDGKLVVIHCNGNDNGVVVESAYSAGFRYVRRPRVFEEKAV